MDSISEILEGLRSQDNYRTLRDAEPRGSRIFYDGKGYVNLSSNDYLGLASDTGAQEKFLRMLEGSGRYLMGNPSSRLVTGNSMEYSELETALENLYPGRRALVFGSGYLANAGILPAVTTSRDLVLADKLVHASIIDGLRLCRCECRRFRHNDLGHLESQLSGSVGKYDNIWVVTESVFSMDGDRAPLRELAVLKDKYGFRLYLDEAHAFGVFGPRGEGLAAQAGYTGLADIIVATFGKAAASTGAFAAVDTQVRELLINRMRTLIYSTALPAANLIWTRIMLEKIAGADTERRKLRELTGILSPGNPEATQIIPIMAYGNGEADTMASLFREKGFWVSPIKSPTVPEGTARLRISLSAGLDREDVERFNELCRNIG